MKRKNNMSLKSLESKRGESEGERVDLKARNLLQGILYYKCLDLGFITAGDFEAIDWLFRKTSEIIDTLNDSYSKLIRAEAEAGNYDLAAEMVIKIIFPNTNKYSRKVA
jgi:hypothetical protein